MWAAGWNNFGQIGDGTTTNHYKSVKVVNVDGSVLVEWSAYPRRCSHCIFKKRWHGVGDGNKWSWSIREMARPRKEHNPAQVKKCG